MLAIEFKCSCSVEDKIGMMVVIVPRYVGAICG